MAAHTTADIIETDTVGALVCYGILHIRSISIDTQIHFTHLKAIDVYKRQAMETATAPAAWDC